MIVTVRRNLLRRNIARTDALVLVNRKRLQLGTDHCSALCMVLRLLRDRREVVLVVRSEASSEYRACRRWWCSLRRW